MLEQFVPAERRAEAVPCRFTQLTEQGQSVEDFYRTGTQADMDEALAVWLRAQIDKIERERGISSNAGVAQSGCRRIARAHEESVHSLHLAGNSVRIGRLQFVWHKGKMW